MSRIIFLDSGPLGLLTHPRQTPEVAAVAEWLTAVLRGGNRVLVPAIVYYEIKRELLRARKSSGIARLEAFTRIPGRYVSLSDEALSLAAELWAKVRQDGKPTADSKGLDIDVIVAAQALSFGSHADNVVVATTNARHLDRFVAASDWSEIHP